MKTYTSIHSKVRRCKVFYDFGDSVLVRIKKLGDYQIKKTELIFK